MGEYPHLNKQQEGNGPLDLGWQGRGSLIVKDVTREVDHDQAEYIEQVPFCRTPTTARSTLAEHSLVCTLRVNTCCSGQMISLQADT